VTRYRRTLFHIAMFVVQLSTGYEPLVVEFSVVPYRDVVQLSTGYEPLCADSYERYCQHAVRFLLRCLLRPGAAGG